MPNIGSLAEIENIRQAIKGLLKTDYDESLLRIADLKSGRSISYAGANHLRAELKENFAFLHHYHVFYILDAILSEHEKLIHYLECLCRYQHHLKLKVNETDDETCLWLLSCFGLDLEEIMENSDKKNILLGEVDFIPNLIKNIQLRVKDTHDIIWFNSDQQEDLKYSIIIFDHSWKIK